MGEKNCIKLASQIKKPGWVTDHCSQQAAKCMCHANHSAGQKKGEKEEQRTPHGCHNRLSSKLTQYHICKNSHDPGNSSCSGRSALHTSRPQTQSTSPLAATLHTNDLKTSLQHPKQTEGCERRPQAAATCPVYWWSVWGKEAVTFSHWFSVIFRNKI